ncbi:hypothetical protein GCM10007425_03420 [Lysinibacillus alkalisoli]|uniref:SLH domain-containing protein n=2 Tax=Lysinibacillus alkalisoli TaxID=1911548 RepID=A0A917FXS6_9BACI|nr:hypothetical protein GCM10007425_03420 [Lysinibacillus alkalisoli]
MIMTKKMFQLAMAATLTTGAIVAVAPTADAAKFTDVKDNSPAGKAINALVERGVIKGYVDGTFRPAAAITRGQMAKMLAHLLELETTDVVDYEYADIPQSHQYYGAISALTELGVFSGYADNTFRPNEPIKREQMAKILVAAYELETPVETVVTFKDVLRNTEVYHNIASLYHYKVTTGISPERFGIGENVSRGQFAQFILRAEQAVKTRVKATITAKQLQAEMIDVNYELDEEEAPFVIHNDGETVGIEPIAEGESTIIVSGSTVNVEGEYEVDIQKKYAVTVTKIKGDFAVELTEVTDVEPTIISVEEEAFGFDPKHIRLETVEGKVVSSDIFGYEKASEDEEDLASYSLTIAAEGTYIATLSDDLGNQKRLALVVTKDAFSLLAMEAMEKNEVIISNDEIGFNVANTYVEQYTAAMGSNDFAAIAMTEEGLKISRNKAGAGVFSVRLTSAQGEVLFVHGLMKELAGITTIEYQVLTAEQMEELLALANSLGTSGVGMPF